MSSYEYKERGNVFFEQRQYQEAIQEYEKAVKVDPTSYKVWYNMGRAYGALGEHAKEIDCYQKVVELNPGHVDA